MNAFQKLDAQDRNHRAAIGGLNDKPIKGGNVHLIYFEDSFGVTVGEEYYNLADGRTFTVEGGTDHVRWCERQDTPISCGPHDADGFSRALVKYADGKTTTIEPENIGFYLRGVEEIQHLKRPKLEILDYDDMCNMPDPTWLVEGLLQERTSALIFGKSNAFKSFIAVDIACSVATGTNWHGSAVGLPKRVLYVATEGSRGVGKQRVPGWMDSHDIPREQRHNISLFCDEIALDSPAHIDDILSRAEYDNTVATLKAGGRVGNPTPRNAYDLIVVDIFGASMDGPETSDETARAWVRSVNRLMKEIGSTVLTIAHTGWADSTRARMHTHFWGSFDTRLIAQGDKESLTTVLKIDRHKDAESDGEWGFRLDPFTMHNGNTTLVPRLCDDVETKQKRRISGKPAIALQALSEALIEQGRTIAGPNYPACPVATLDHWKAMCQRHGLTDSDNPETARKAFNRAKEALLSKGLIKQFDDNVWKVSNDD